MPSVQEDLGGGRSAVPSRHGQKGGRGGGWGGAPELWFLHRRRNHGGGVSLRDAEALGEGREGTGRGVAEGPQCRQERGQEGVNPLIGLALTHAE